MYWKRHLKPTLQKALSQFPVLLITGPRQTGKTELLKNEFSSYKYHSFDALDVRTRASVDPRSFLTDPQKKLIFDEIQEVPEFLTYIKEYVDQNKQAGQIILTGSHQFHLMKGVTESLAGRVALFELLPFSYREIKPHHSPQLQDLLFLGQYPQPQTTPDLSRDLWFNSYIRTYLERDLQAQVEIRDLKNFEILLQLLASSVGQELNYEKLGSKVGVKGMTVKSWINALEAAYIIYRLPPYFENFGKRLIKSSKIYFYDTGLASHLMRLQNAEQTLTSPFAGVLFENLIIMERIKTLTSQAKQPHLYFWRSHDGLEVDLIEDLGTHLEATEIKLTHTITDQHVPNLKRFEEFAKNKSLTLNVVSQSTKPNVSHSFTHYHWQEWALRDGK